MKDVIEIIVKAMLVQRMVLEAKRVKMISVKEIRKIETTSINKS